MMGNLFYRKVSPFDIEKMTYSQMKYWNEWVNNFQEIEKKEYDKLKAK